jgi:pimeloyl-ACP methyl ester carboxylesterase
VIPLLEADGLNVTAVQNPLTSLAEDVATTRRLLAQQDGPTVLVGHSYAGFVITEAGNAPNVAALVYVSSYGPDEGESHDDLVRRFPAPQSQLYAWIKTDSFGSRVTGFTKPLRTMSTHLTHAFLLLSRSPHRKRVVLAYR